MGSIASTEADQQVKRSCWNNPREWCRHADAATDDGGMVMNRRDGGVDVADGPSSIPLLMDNHRNSQEEEEEASFQHLQERCLSAGVLFEDPEFPATAEALGADDYGKVNWCRPKELTEEPRLFVDGASRFDVEQGELGDCWMLSPVANLTLQPDLFRRVVPRDQSFQYKYAGIFRFRFWQFGSWVEVVVDDRLPSRNGQLLFLRSASHAEFWSPLLEKAYAKLFGSYAALDGGQATEAMVDLTGGVSETILLSSPPPQLFLLLAKSLLRGSMACCSFSQPEDPGSPYPKSPSPEWRTRPKLGLVPGHAYSVTRARALKNKGLLVRLRNPWGNQVEWTGPWSDGSPEWTSVSEEDRRRMGLNFDADGEFWMDFNDFLRHFQVLQMCHVFPEADDGARQHRWVMTIHKGAWVKGSTAGGCRNNTDTFWKNPHFVMTLREPDEGHMSECSVLVSLQQEDTRGIRTTPWTIGFSIFQVEDPSSVLPRLEKRAFLSSNAPVASSIFINTREVSLRTQLPLGTYLVVPSTFEPDKEARFLIRIVSEK